MIIRLTCCTFPFPGPHFFQLLSQSGNPRGDAKIFSCPACLSLSYDWPSESDEESFHTVEGGSRRATPCCLESLVFHYLVIWSRTNCLLDNMPRLEINHWRRREKMKVTCLFVHLCHSVQVNTSRLSQRRRATKLCPLATPEAYEDLHTYLEWSFHSKLIIDRDLRISAVDHQWQRFGNVGHRDASIIGSEAADFDAFTTARLWTGLYVKSKRIAA
ncbi:uncharacterized protein BT62DRAFT_383984 [Guyanagaster necrorhizus]|uniref:Uncharacterized protein n=1 Tax=Guyanagaster necrorhizus TaxID=856835 RepID=A0A9P8AP06_9AGAR|nr:uncharacterized protein BT62DRAFT_383984 [Guyanagaster necrorhizus MCA 3950]KAG7442460.1 hypothetical protein BT62DRAFT_383984 [Guyanagaster necrorhizus MCA 3950]